MQQIFIICIHLRTLRMTMLACALSLLIPAIIIHLQIFANVPGNANMRFIIFMIAIFFTRLQAFPTVPKSNANMRSISVAILVNHLQQFANVRMALLTYVSSTLSRTGGSEPSKTDARRPGGGRLTDNPDSKKGHHSNASNTTLIVEISESSESTMQDLPRTSDVRRDLPP